MLLFSVTKLRCVSKNLLSQQKALVMTQHSPLIVCRQLPPRSRLRRLFPHSIVTNAQQLTVVAHVNNPARQCLRYIIVPILLLMLHL